MKTSNRHNDSKKAFFWMFLSGIGFSGMTTLIKIIGQTVPYFQAIFMRAAVNFALAMILAIKSKEILFPSGPAILYFRSLVGFVGIVCLFYGINHLPLSIAVLLGSSAPLFVLLFSGWFLHENISRKIYIWIAFAFLGILVLINPDIHGVSATPIIPFFVGLIGAAAAGLAYLSVRKATERFGVNIIVLYLSSITLVLSLPFSRLASRPPSIYQVGLLILMGLFGSLGQLAMTRAYTYAQAGVVSVFGLISPLDLFHDSWFHS